MGLTRCEEAPGFAALHRVKYIDRLFVNKIIQYFEQVAIAIKAKKQVFIIKTIHNIIIDNILDSPFDIRFRYTVFKG
jgi:uncharacterized FlgJ-related protein